MNSMRHGKVDEKLHCGKTVYTLSSHRYRSFR